MCFSIPSWAIDINSQGIGNLVSMCAALVAIGALVYQSHSTRKQIKLQNFVEYTKRYQEIILNFPEGINRKDFVIENIKDEAEKNKTMRYMRAYIDLCFEEHTLYKKDFIDDDLWSIWEGGMKSAFSKPAFKQAWAAIRKDTQYGEEFMKFADSYGL